MKEKVDIDLKAIPIQTWIISRLGLLRNMDGYSDKQLNLFKTRPAGGAIKGKDVFGWLDLLARDLRFFCEIRKRTNSFGCLFEGWDVFPGGYLQSMDSANQSLHLSTLRSAGEFCVPRDLVARNAAMTSQLGGGSRSRNLRISLGRDDGFDPVQWIIPHSMDYRQSWFYRTKARRRIRFRSWIIPVFNGLPNEMISPTFLEKRVFPGKNRDFFLRDPD
jgi:hypothetical protein